MPTPTDDNNAWGQQGRKDRAYPPLSHAPLEPRRNERSPGKGILPGPSGWSPRRRGTWPIKRRQEGTRQRLYPLDKAAAHALRAAAA